MAAVRKLAPVAPDPAPAAAAAPQPAPARSLLRFITCGSVDDGKSTLLGRLLYETGAVFEDQLDALDRDSARFGTTGGDLDFALLLDGLSAEREQGITIDVAYRYFSTPARAFIAADTPGHEQYTRNMATGASTADTAIILVDARKGLLAQTRRHSYIVSMLGVRQVIVAVNKMDLVGYDEGVFRAICADYAVLARTLGFADVHLVPLSARFGDNVATRSAAMPWHDGPPLLALLETLEVAEAGQGPFRLPVQWVNRPDLDFRGYSGTLAGGRVSVGDAVRVLPRGQTSTVSGILGPAGPQDAAVDGQSVTLILADEIDVSRGDVLAPAVTPAGGAREVAARLLALSGQALEPGRAYIAKLGTATATVRLQSLVHQIDVHDYRPRPAADLAMNGIGLALLRFETPLAATTYAECRTLGALLLIDPVSNDSIGLGVIEKLGAADAGGEGGPEPLIGRLRRALIGAGLLAVDADVDAARRYLGWRGISALTVSALVAMAGAGLAWALGAGLADAVLRPLARMGHNAVWDKLEERRRIGREAALNLDGGGI